MLYPDGQAQLIHPKPADFRNPGPGRHRLITQVYLSHTAWTGNINDTSYHGRNFIRHKLHTHSLGGSEGPGVCSCGWCCPWCWSGFGAVAAPVPFFLFSISMVCSLILLSLFSFGEENMVLFLELEVSGFKGWSYYFTRGSWSPYFYFLQCSLEGHFKHGHEGFCSGVSSRHYFNH